MWSTENVNAYWMEYARASKEWIRSLSVYSFFGLAQECAHLLLFHSIFPVVSLYLVNSLICATHTQTDKIEMHFSIIVKPKGMLNIHGFFYNAERKQ